MIEREGAAFCHIVSFRIVNKNLPDFKKENTDGKIYIRLTDSFIFPAILFR